MEKLPEKWCIKNDYQEVREFLSEKYNIPSIKKEWGSYDYIGHAGCSSNNGVLGGTLEYFQKRYPCTVITLEEFKKCVVLEEKEEWVPKVGDWIYCEYKGSHNNDYRNDKYIPVFQLKEISKQSENYMRPVLEQSTGVPVKYCRPALPHEIPQEEVEYVKSNGWLGDMYLDGKIYPVVNGEVIPENKGTGARFSDFNEIFTLSTREAFEAQKNNQFENHIEEVNKVSQLNINKNEHSKENTEKLPRKSFNFPRGEGEAITAFPVKKRNFPS